MAMIFALLRRLAGPRAGVTECATGATGAVCACAAASAPPAVSWTAETGAAAFDSVGPSEPAEPSGPSPLSDSPAPADPPRRSTTGTDWVGTRTGVTDLKPIVCPAWTSASIRAASSAVGRSAGSLAISAASTGPSDPARRDSGSGSSTTAASVVIGESRRNGDWPSTAAYSVAPRPHRSEAGPGRSPWARSGAR